MIYSATNSSQMQLNFEKRNLKSCNGSLRFINGKFFMSFYAILKIKVPFFSKKSFWANVLCNFLNDMVIKSAIFSATLWISCNSMQFYAKKNICRTFFHENHDFKKHEIAIKILII